MASRALRAFFSRVLRSTGLVAFFLRGTVGFGVCVSVSVCGNFLLVGPVPIEIGKWERSGAGEEELEEEDDNVGDDEVLDDGCEVHAPGRETGRIAAVANVVAALESHGRHPITAREPMPFQSETIAGVGAIGPAERNGRMLN